MPSRSPTGDNPQHRSTALGFDTQCDAPSILACGRAGAHKRLPYGVSASPMSPIPGRPQALVG
jgi:hypothetical protein